MDLHNLKFQIYVLDNAWFCKLIIFALALVVKKTQRDATWQQFLITGLISSFTSEKPSKLKQAITIAKQWSVGL